METPQTPQKRGGATKKARYDIRVRAALDELLATELPQRITISAICDLAGVSADPLGKTYHTQLRNDLHDAINEALALRNDGNKRRAKARTDLQTRLEELERQKKELKAQLRNAQIALNLLGQMLETAISGRPLAQVLPMQRPPPKRLK